MSNDRPLLIFVSDLHLTDALHGSAVPKAALFERFWSRIQESRGQRPAELCFVGDVFDLVRSPAWFESRSRPYHDPRGDVSRIVEGIVERIIEREAEFFSAIRRRVESGELRLHYLSGNHDRLLRHAPNARQKVWKAFTGEDSPPQLASEKVFRDHGVLAYHGHVGDAINWSQEGEGTIGDAIGSELITRFPVEVRRKIGPGHPELDDIDDVRPIYAVPAWVRRLSTMDRSLLRPVGETWSMLVEEFLSNSYVKDWMKSQSRLIGMDAGKKLRLLLELSTGRIMAKAHDQRLTKLYKYFQHAFDGRMAKLAGEELQKRGGGLRYVVNGHSHFSSMVPLGNVGGNPAVYFNTGTWRTVHQIGHSIGGRPSFLPYDAMSYLVFFPKDDRMNRDFEWWTGALFSRDRADA
jgi:UDP-2,3-diacylglucosamine pyrophosphatase LpxH